MKPTRHPKRTAGRRRPSARNDLGRRVALVLTVLSLVATVAVVGAPSDSGDTHAASNHDLLPREQLLVAALSADTAPMATASPDLRPERAPLPTIEDEIPAPLLGDAETGFAANGNKKAKKIAKLDKKLVKVEAKLDFAETALSAWTGIAAQAELDVDAAEAALSAAYQQLADALAMPDGTPAEKQAKADAIAAAKKAVKLANKALSAANKARKKANKKVAKLIKFIDNTELKVANLIIKLEELDPGHFENMGATTLSGQGGPASLTFAWLPVSGADSYNIYYSQQSGIDITMTGFVNQPSSPLVAYDVVPGLTFYAVVTAVTDGVEGPPSNEASATSLEMSDPSIYFPVWADATPSNVITLDYNAGLSASDNGALLRTAVLALQPGDSLEIGGGTWSIAAKFSPSASGTATDPIWIVAQEGETPVITRPDANQNVMNPAGSYMCFRGLEITGGSAGIKIDAANNIWIDQCHIHHVGEAGLAANSADTSKLYITRNEIHDTAGYGEGMYLGANNGAVIMSESVIALNEVHDLSGPGVLQGDGIELKQGSWGNWIAENTVYNTKYPCILAYGTNGQPVNLIERNVLIGSGDNVMQVQGEAIVRSNLIVNGATGFQSNDHQGSTRDLTFVHNTVINSGQAVRLSNWNNRPGMVFANNAIYTQSATAVQFSAGSTGVTIAGNVVVGGVSGASASGFVPGVGLGDFEGANWSGTTQDATPSTDSALLGAGDPAWAVDEDLGGDGFGGAPAAGAVAGP